MGKLRIFILFIAVAMSSAACTKEEPHQPELPKTLSIPFTEKSVSSNQTLFDLNVQSNCDWKIKTAIVSISFNTDIETARQKLKRHNGVLRKVLNEKEIEK